MASDTDSLMWCYLDRHGQEFGPFAANKMRAWFSAGYFPVGEKLLVRRTEWRHHVPVHDLWPEGPPFAGQHREPGYRPPPQAPAMGPPPPAWGFMPPHMPPEPHGYHPHPFGGYGSPPPPGPGYWPAPGVPHFPPAPHHPGMPVALGYGKIGRDSRPPPPPPQEQRNARSRSPRQMGPIAQQGRPNQGNNTNNKAKGPPTTGMLRNIPNTYDQKMLLDELHAAGFEKTYDFFYLPMDHRNSVNLGYAFINFVKPSDFKRFSEEFQEHQFKEGGPRRADVSPAQVQGFAANVRNSATKTFTADAFKPLVIKNGVTMSLEDAAKSLPEPDAQGRKKRRQKPKKNNNAKAGESAATAGSAETPNKEEANNNKEGGEAEAEAANAEKEQATEKEEKEEKSGVTEGSSSTADVAAVPEAEGAN